MSKEGDWYCRNCGYVSASRVTYSETCDTCHAPVEWHTTDEVKALEVVTRQRDRLLEAGKDLAFSNIHYFDTAIIGKLDALRTAIEDIEKPTH